MHIKIKITILLLISFLPLGKLHTKETINPDPKNENQKEELVGFDTISLTEPEGNWLKKRWWWDKAQKKYEKIKYMVSDILDARMFFFQKRNEADKNIFDPFYMDIGLTRGELKIVLSSLLDILTNRNEDKEMLSKSEREFLTKLKKEEIKLKQTKADVDGIKKLDNAINDDLIKLMDQINLSRKYEDMAWQMFKDIAKEINHLKARENYYKMDNLWKNVQDIYAYIRGPFTNHFNTIVADADEKVETIKMTAEDLRKSGIDLKKEYEKQRVMPKPPTKKTPPKKEVPEKEIPEEPVGWLSYIWNIITWPFRKIWSAISTA